MLTIYCSPFRPVLFMFLSHCIVLSRGERLRILQIVYKYFPIVQPTTKCLSGAKMKLKLFTSGLVNLNTAR